MSYCSSFHHAGGWPGLHLPIDIRCWFEHCSISAPSCIELCWVTPPSKGQTVKYWIIFTSHWNETGWWANLLSAPRLSGAATEKKNPLSLFTQQHQVHKQGTYLNERDNYLNIFPLLLQWAPINEWGCFKLSARVCPKGINFTKARIWVWGWMVGVGGGNWFNVSEAMPARAEYKHTVIGAIRNAEGVTMASTHMHYIPLSAGVTCNKSNHLPSRQQVLFLSLKLLMRKGDMKNCDL